MDNVNLKERLGEKTNAAETSENTAVVPINNGYSMLTKKALEIINENLKNQPLSYQLFDVIKSPSGENIAFTIPGISGDDIAKELTGIIIDYTTPRAYWDTPDPKIGTPPICFSKDSITSVTEGKPCAHCPHNDFGSKNGETNAKACKESVQILLLRPKSIIPVIVRVPVSSKILFQKYMIRLLGKLIPLSGTVTKITLERAVSKTGQPYPTFKFEAAEALNDDTAATAKAFGQKFRDILNISEAPVVLDIQEAE